LGENIFGTGNSIGSSKNNRQYQGSLSFSGFILDEYLLKMDGILFHFLINTLMLLLFLLHAGIWCVALFQGRCVVCDARVAFLGGQWLGVRGEMPGKAY